MRPSLILIVIFFGLSLFSACKKNDNKPVGPYYMKWTIGSTSYSDTSAFTIYSGSYFVICGLSAEGTLLNLFIKNYTGVGSYNIVGTGTNFAEWDINPNHSQVISISGNITVSDTSSGKITGTFYFICNDSTNISNGIFVGKVP